MGTVGDLRADFGEVQVHGFSIGVGKNQSC
jgi:hypothetical protein